MGESQCMSDLRTLDNDQYAHVSFGEGVKILSDKKPQRESQVYNTIRMVAVIVCEQKGKAHSILIPVRLS